MNFIDSSPIAPVAQILAGLILLLFGRRLFWMFVGVVGFVVGTNFGAQLAAHHGGWVVLAVAASCGLAAAILAVVLQKFSVLLGSAAACGVIALRVASDVGSSDLLQLIAFAAGALVGGTLVLFLYEWAIIVLSSLWGAGLVVTALQIPPVATITTAALLAAIGIVIQSQHAAGEPEDHLGSRRRAHSPQS